MKHSEWKKSVSVSSENSILTFYKWPWTTKPVLSSTAYLCNSQKYIVWVKIIDFSFMPKKIISKRIFWKCPTLNISKFIFGLVICVAKDLIWTTLKAIFSIFRFFAPSDSRFSNSCISAKYCPILRNGKLIYSAFRWCINWPLWLALWSRGHI